MTMYQSLPRNRIVKARCRTCSNNTEEQVISQQQKSETDESWTCLKSTSGIIWKLVGFYMSCLWNMCLGRTRFVRQIAWQQCRSIGGRLSRSATATGASLGHSVQPDWATSSDATKCRKKVVRSTYFTLIWMMALMTSLCGPSKTVRSM